MPIDLSALTVDEIRRRFLRPEGSVTLSLLARLRTDDRAGVRQIGALLSERRRKEQAERRRVGRMLRAERRLWSSGIQHVAGVDEAGVGPLAGPVVAAAVVFAPGVFIAGVDDSKRLPATAREELAELVRKTAVALAVGEADVAEIDQLNVYWASLLAMRRAVEGLSLRPQHLLVDARRIPDLEIPQTSVVDGDRLHFSIAAASLIAKTRRDRIMDDLAKSFPAYGFERHKGYSTPEHQGAIRKHGPCAVHRQSYEFVRELSGDCSRDYYRLKAVLEASDTAEALARFRRLLSFQAGLTPGEVRKLKLLLARKDRGLPKRRQLRLLGELP